jgi:hypothetical protein
MTVSVVVEVVAAGLIFVVLVNGATAMLVLGATTATVGVLYAILRLYTKTMVKPKTQAIKRSERVSMFATLRVFGQPCMGWSCWWKENGKEG